MSANPPVIRPVRQGDPISAAAWNRVGSAIRELSVQPSPGAAENLRAAQRTVVMEIVALATAAPWQLQCKLLGETGSGLDAAVDPPWTFYLAARGAVSYSYSSQNVRVANGTETQTLTPTYEIGDQLLVLMFSDRFVDWNNDGRQWAADPPPP